jgi:hypothetical protein
LMKLPAIVGKAPICEEKNDSWKMQTGKRLCFGVDK